MIDHVLANPEAETYQFVVRAIPHSADAEVARLARRCLDTEALRQEHVARISAEAAVSDLRTRIDDLERRANREAEVDLLRHQVAEVDLLRHQIAEERHLEAIFSTRTMRMLAPFRAAYAAPVDGEPHVPRGSVDR